MPDDMDSIYTYAVESLEACANGVREISEQFAQYSDKLDTMIAEIQRMRQEKSLYQPERWRYVSVWWRGVLDEVMSYLVSKLVFPDLLTNRAHTSRFTVVEKEVPELGPG